MVFSPIPTYELASVSSAPVALPERARAYADPTAEVGKDSQRGGSNGGDRAAKPQPEKNTNAVARQPKPSSNVFNDAQIASIKARLRLTADQQHHWPAVEAALRNITYKKDAGSQKTAGKLLGVDANSPAVHQLKAAAIPLLMSFSEQQKSEVRQLARLMGLEQIAQAI